MLGRNARKLVYGAEVAPTFMDGGRFWYRNRMQGGFEFIVVDPVRLTRQPAFDHARLAAALSMAADTAYAPTTLPFERIRLNDTGTQVRFVLPSTRAWSCDLTTYTCTSAGASSELEANEVSSPDARMAAFVRDDNLWVRDRSSGTERQLSKDGVPDYAYGVVPEDRDEVTNRRGSLKRAPVLRWSPDSRRIATWRLDERHVKEVYHLETAVGRSILHRSRYALPGDSIIPTYDFFVFDVASGGSVKVDLPPRNIVSSTCCGVMYDSVWKDLQWSGDSKQIFFTSLARGYKEIELFAADPLTGKARRIMGEKSATYIELNVNSVGPNWRVSPDGSEVLWFSQRDGWGHLYSYNTTTGALRHQVTTGTWVVFDILAVDFPGRQALVSGVGREPGDPYVRHLYRVSLDGAGSQRLTSEDADHAVRVSPDQRFIVDTWSRRDTVPTTVVRDRTGRVVMTLERGDVTDLRRTGWRWPVPYSTKARDGVTDLQGFLYFPSDFDSTKRYPVVDYIYPGPQTGPIGLRSFNVEPMGDPQAFAELGFIVLTIDAMGTPGRSKAFHDSYYGRLADNGIPDHITSIKQLAARYPQLDLDRVGIMGHSGGGFSSTRAILQFPDFFKVAVSGAGNHDNRSFGFYWGERYQGMLVRNADGTDNYDAQANHRLAANLKGKFMLSYGTLDDRVHPNATLLLIDALIANNKDFELVVMPNRNHGYGSEGYILRRSWDFLVRHLLGAEPPAGYWLDRPLR
ncbi:MAG: DPP IV N-terminal domain-containing protein [Cytophagaceae bacterium]|nr:DPP IV N-terminal domain-containing protein [Gemmatimonadaceae bacterium]